MERICRNPQGLPASYFRAHTINFYDFEGQSSNTQHYESANTAPWNGNWTDAGGRREERRNQQRALRQGLYVRRQERRRRDVLRSQQRLRQRDARRAENLQQQNPPGGNENGGNSVVEVHQPAGSPEESQRAPGHPDRNINNEPTGMENRNLDDEDDDGGAGESEVLANNERNGLLVVGEDREGEAMVDGTNNRRLRGNDRTIYTTTPPISIQSREHNEFLISRSLQIRLNWPRPRQGPIIAFVSFQPTRKSPEAILEILQHIHRINAADWAHHETRTSVFKECGSGHQEVIFSVRVSQQSDLPFAKESWRSAFSSNALMTNTEHKWHSMSYSELLRCVILSTWAEVEVEKRKWLCHDFFLLLAWSFCWRRGAALPFVSESARCSVPMVSRFLPTSSASLELTPWPPETTTTTVTSGGPPLPSHTLYIIKFSFKFTLLKLFRLFGLEPDVFKSKNSV